MQQQDSHALVCSPCWLCLCPDALSQDAQRLADVACCMLQRRPLKVQVSACIPNVLVFERLERVPGIFWAACPAAVKEPVGAC